MNKIFANLQSYRWSLLALAIFALYFLRLESDCIAGLFGIFTADEGPYLLAAKQQAMFGAAHVLENDHWRPELIVPLLHAYALLTITYNDPVWLMRFGMAVQVTAGIVLIAWLAGKYHGSRRHAIACLLCLLLNPILFFYARLGLAEGQQFLMLALILCLFFRLHHCRRLNEAFILCSIAGALTAILFIAKISGITACIGAGAGLLATLYQNSSLARKPLLAGCYIAAGIAALSFYFGVIVGNQLPDWWSINMEDHALRQVPLDLGMLWEMFSYKWPFMAYYLSLMPIFALYLLSLPLAADARKGFVFTLFLMAMAMIAAESFALGSIRRSFFGLNMLSIISGFVCLEYAQSGLRFSLRLPKILSAAVIFAYAAGMALLLWYGSIPNHDLIYTLFCTLFLLIIALGMLAAFHAGQTGPRRVLIALAALTSLAPMLFQAFFAPNTREEVVAAIENIVPADGVIIGPSAPWYLQGLHRKIIFTNCVYGFKNLAYVNDLDQTATQKKLYFFGELLNYEGHCVPSDFKRYRQIGEFQIFIPTNHGGGLGTSSNWVYTVPLFLYEKK